MAQPNPEFTGRVKAPVAGPSGIPEVDRRAAALQREDAARRARQAEQRRTALAAQTNTDVRSN